MRDFLSTHKSQEIDPSVDAEIEALHRDLKEIHEEIRRMYRRSD